MSYEQFIPEIEANLEYHAGLLSLWSYFRKMTDLICLDYNDIEPFKIDDAKKTGRDLFSKVKDVHRMSHITPYIRSLCFNTHIFLWRCKELETDMSGIGCLQLLEKGNDRVKECVKKKTSLFANHNPNDQSALGEDTLPISLNCVVPSPNSSSSFPSDNEVPQLLRISKARSHINCPNGPHQDECNIYHSCGEYCYNRYNLSLPLPPLPNINTNEETRRVCGQKLRNRNENCQLYFPCQFHPYLRPEPLPIAHLSQTLKNLHVCGCTDEWCMYPNNRFFRMAGTSYVHHPLTQFLLRIHMPMLSMVPDIEQRKEKLREEI